MCYTDTIAAISTPAGSGAIGVLRLSGPQAVEIAEKCFKPLGPKGLTDHAPRCLVYGDLLDLEGRPIDRVLCTYSLSPASYTGEDTACLLYTSWSSPLIPRWPPSPGQRGATA